MTQFTPITDHPELARDRNSGAVVSKDQRAYNEYQAKRRKDLAALKRLDTLEQKVASLETGIGQILTILQSMQPKSIPANQHQFEPFDDRTQ